MKNKTFKKSISLIMTVLMVLSCWVWVAPIEADALLGTYYGKPEGNGSHYQSGTTNAYGTPVFDGNTDRWFQWKNGDDWTTIYYPSQIYLDKTESLEGAGYYMNVQWHFGDSANYRIFLGANVWGDNSAFGSYGDGRIMTMNNIFSNYAVDASCTDLYYTAGDGGIYNGGSNYDLRIVGYGYSSQGSDGFDDNDVRHEKYVMLRSRQSTNNATIYLKGNPSESYVGKTTEYNTSGDSYKSYGIAQNYSGLINKSWGKHTNGTKQFRSKGSSSSYMEGEWIEMQWFVTVYDKSDLNGVIDNANNLLTQTGKYTAASLNNLQTVLNNNKGVLTTRATNQDAIDTAKKNIQAAIDNLVDYSLTFDNLFAFNKFEIGGSLTVNERTETGFTVTSTAADGNTGFSYLIPVESGKTYVLSADVNIEAVSGGYDMYIHTLDANQAGETTAVPDTSNGAHREGNVYISLTGQTTNTKPYIRFTAGDSTEYIRIRFDANAVDNKLTVNNIRLYCESDLSDVSFVPTKMYKNKEILGTKFDAPTRTGYTFNRWYVDTVNPNGKYDTGEEVTDSNGNVIASLQTFEITQDWVLHSDWTEHQYNISFDANGGSGSKSTISNVKYSEDKAIKANTEITREGYTFAGWNTKADGTGTAIADGATVSKLSATNGATVTLYAQWKQNKYTVTFNFADGTSDSKQYNYGATITVPANSNSTKAPDATNHYTYTWTPAVATIATGDATYSEVLTTAAHNWGDWTTTVQPSCTAEGTKTRECNDCGYIETATLGAVAHSIKHVAAVPATCTDDGNIEYWYCSECLKKYSDANATNEITDVVDPATGHTEVKLPAVEATCTATGLTGGKKCSVCGETLVAQNETPKLAHTEATREENRKEASCGATGSYTLVTYCSVCKNDIKSEDKIIPATGAHSLGDWITDKEPTCITDGSKHKECANCTYTENGTIAATGVHVYGEWTDYSATEHSGRCTADIACDATVTEAHTKSETIKVYDSTYHYYKCEKCDAYGDLLNGVFTKNVKEECYGEGTTFTQLEGNENSHTATCKCGNSKTAAHSWAGWVADPKNTENNQGKMTNTCKACGYQKTTECNYKVTEEVEAGCTVNGHRTWKCSDCSNGYTEILRAPGHTAGEAVTENKNDATCTTDGSYDTVVYCSVCSFEMDRVTTTVTATGHTFGDVTVANEATCEETGNYAYKQCTECDKYFAADAELYSKEAKESTDAFVIPANGHNYGEWIAEVPATCSATGTKGHYDCSACDKYFDIDKNEIADLTIEIVSDNHVNTTEFEAVKETCLTVGYTAGTYCDDCKNWISGHVEIPAIAHNNKIHHEKVEPTCVKEGTIEYWECPDCDKNFSDEACETVVTKLTIEIAPDNHVNTTEHNAVKETCLTVGYTAGVYCEDCQKWISGHVEIPAIAHKNKIHHEKVEPTCVKEGTIEYWECPDCGNNFSDEACKTVVTDITIEIDTSAHDWNDVTYTWTETEDTWKCIAARVCKRNEAHIETEFATIESEVKTPATCEGVGTTTYTATFDADWAKTQSKDVEDIEAIGHNYSSEVTVRPTQNADGTWTNGTYTYTCKNDASHTYTDDAIRADYTEFDEVVEALKEILTNEKLTDEGKTAVNSVLAKADALAKDYVTIEQPKIDELVSELNRTKTAAEDIIANSGKPQPIVEAISGIKVQFLKETGIETIESLQLKANGGFDPARLRLTNNNNTLPITVTSVVADKANIESVGNAGTVIDINGAIDLDITAPGTFNETGIITYTITYKIGSDKTGYLMDKDGNPVVFETKAYIYVKGAAYTPYHYYDEDCANGKATSEWEFTLESDIGDFALVHNYKAPYAAFGNTLLRKDDNSGLTDFVNNFYDYEDNKCYGGCSDSGWKKGDAHAATYRFYIDTSLAPTWQAAGLKAVFAETTKSNYENATLKYVRVANNQAYLDGISGSDKTFSVTQLPGASTNNSGAKWTVTSSGTMEPAQYDNPDKDKDRNQQSYVFGNHPANSSTINKSIAKFSGAIPQNTTEAKLMYSPRMEYFTDGLLVDQCEATTMTTHLYITSYDKGELRDAVNAAEQAAYNPNYYNTEKYETYENALKTAKEVLGKVETTQSEVDVATAALNNAIADLTRAEYVLTVTHSIHESADKNSEATSDKINYYLLAAGADFEVPFDADAIALDTINKYDSEKELTITGTTEHTYHYWYIDFSKVQAALDSADAVLVKNPWCYTDEYRTALETARDNLKAVDQTDGTDTPELQSEVDALIEAINTLVAKEQDESNHTHVEGELITDKAPTCTEKGSGHYDCVYCGITFKNVVIDAAGHKYGEWIAEIAATCVKDGIKGHYTCSVCNKDFDADNNELTDLTITINSENHVGKTYTKDEDIVAGTCIKEKTWNEVTYCSDCNENLSTVAKTGEKDATNHVGETYTKDENVVAGTCIKEKTWNEVTYCSDCNAKLGTVAKTGEIDATNHVGKANVIKNNKEATCSEKGYSGDIHWSCCDVLETKGSVVSKLPHKEATREENRNEASCGADGSYSLVTYCLVCSEVIKTEEVTIPATGNHNYVTETDRKEPTCQEKGYYVMTCGCGASEKTEIETVDHKYETYVANNDATCQKNETETAECSFDCGEKHTREIENSTVDHKYTTYTSDKNAKCEEDGTKTALCDYGCETKNTVTDVGSALGHDWADTTYNFAEDGSSCTAQRVCKNDATHVEDAKATITSSVKTPATCTVDGWTTYVADFNESWAAEQKLDVQDIAAIGHNYDTTKSESNLTRPVLVDGTWTQGYYTYTCKNDVNHTDKEFVDRASYTAYVAAWNNLESLLSTDITEEAKVAINKILEENDIADNLIESEQATVDTAEANLKYAFEQYNGSLNTYTVTFVVDGKETEIVVISGNDATAPTDVKKDYDETYHYEFIGWDKEFTNIKSDLVVTAKFDAKAHSYTHTKKDDSYHTDMCTCGYSKDVEHTETSVVTTKASCEADGVRTYTCSICNVTRTTVIPKRAHNVVDTTVALEPTCSATGTMNQKCDNVATDEYEACNYTTTRVMDKVPTAHKWETEYTVDEKATCEADGSKSYHCEYCDAKNLDSVEAIAKRAHSYTDNGVKTEATCLAEGVMNTICTNVETATHEACTHKSTKVISIDSTNHAGTASVLKNNKAATCTEKGYTGDTYWSCCDKLYANGKEIAIDADAHTTDETRVEGYVAPTCTTPGATGDTKYECCGAIKVASTEIPVIADAHTGTANVLKDNKAATCTAKGYTGDTYWSCCDKLYAKGTAIEIDANAHTTDKTYVEGYVAPTCTTPGATGDTKYDCCGAIKVASTVIPVDADAHKWSTTYTVDTKASCDTTGAKSFHCVYCGEINRASVVEIPKREHNLVDTTVALDPTCSDVGKMNQKCVCEETSEYKACDYTTTKDIPVNPDAHKAEDEYIQTKAPTCKVTGEEKLYCEYCDAVLDTREVVIDSAAHKWETEYTVDEKATCEADGSKSYHCEYCDAKNLDSVEAIAKRAHSYTDNGVKNEATCLAEGVMNTICTNAETDTHKACTHESTRVIPKKDHSYTGEYVWDYSVEPKSHTRKCVNGCNSISTETEICTFVEEIVASTCVSEGYTKHTCTVCGGVYADNYTEASGHAWGSWKHVEGTETHQRICNNDAEHIETVACNIDKVYIAPTCKSAGIIKRTCVDCDKVYESRVLDKTAHRYSEDGVENYVVVSPSCTAPGKKYLVCVSCGYENISEAVSYGQPMGHLLFVLKDVKPTCTTKGYTEYVCMYEGCTHVQTTEYPATGHNLDKNGKCSDCNKEFEADGSKKDTCICHRDSGIMKFIYKIVLFFWRLFKIKPVCDCGTLHY